jgi:signal transduction histidine kinase
MKNYSYKGKKQKTNEVKVGQESYVNIKISVIDTGIGITKEGISKLFIDFGKLQENQARNR